MSKSPKCNLIQLHYSLRVWGPCICASGESREHCRYHNLIFPSSQFYTSISFGKEKFLKHWQWWQLSAFQKLIQAVMLQKLGHHQVRQQATLLFSKTLDHTIIIHGFVTENIHQHQKPGFEWTSLKSTPDLSSDQDFFQTVRSSQLPPPFCQVPLTVCRYPFILLGEEGHCESKVYCPRTQHNDNDPSQAGPHPIPSPMH